MARRPLPRFATFLLVFALGAASGVLAVGAWSKSRVTHAVAGARAAGRAEAEQAPKQAAALQPIMVREAVDAEDKPAGPVFDYEYVAPRSAELQPLYERAKQGDLLRKLPEVQALDGLLLLPKPLKYVTAECGEVSAFYSPERGEVVMCYETMKVLYDRGQELAAGDDTLGEDYAARYLLANLRFILMHETGHALIDLLDLPITGREEDAVDQLATAIMQRFPGMDETSVQVTDNLRMAANWFLMRSTGQYSLDAYADEHSLGEQRYFNLQCLLYGTNPARYVAIVTSGDLPEARSRSCPAEARRVSRAWLRLLLPHVAPRYEMSEEEANKFFEQKELERDREARVPYVR